VVCADISNPAPQWYLSLVALWPQPYQQAASNNMKSSTLDLIMIISGGDRIHSNILINYHCKIASPTPAVNFARWR
jgi:hypothetical protein